MPQEVLGFPGEMLQCCSEMLELCWELCWFSRHMLVSPGKMLGCLMEVSGYSREVFGFPEDMLWRSQGGAWFPTDMPKEVLVCLGNFLGTAQKCLHAAGNTRVSGWDSRVLQGGS